MDSGAPGPHFSPLGRLGGSGPPAPPASAHRAAGSVLPPAWLPKTAPASPACRAVPSPDGEAAAARKGGGHPETRPSLFREGQPRRASPRSPAGRRQLQRLGRRRRGWRAPGAGTTPRRPLASPGAWTERLFRKRTSPSLASGPWGPRSLTPGRRPTRGRVQGLGATARKGSWGAYVTRRVCSRAQSFPRAHTRQAPRPRDERARGLRPSPPARRPPRYTRRSPPPRVGGCPRSCLTGGPAALASPAPADGSRRPTQGAGVPLVPVAVAEQVGAGGGRRRGDRRGRQPGAGRGGLEGEDWVAAGGTVSPSLRPPPRQPQPDAERAERPQLRAERRDGPPRRSLGTAASASLRPGASAAKREARAGLGSARLPKMAARPRGPSRSEPPWPLRPLVPPADHFLSFRRPPLPAASPWRPTDRAARGVRRAGSPRAGAVGSGSRSLRAG